MSRIFVQDFVALSLFPRTVSLEYQSEFACTNYSICLDVNNFEIFQLCGLVTSKPSGGKNPKFIRNSVKQIKKYGYRVKNRSYLRFCPAKSGFLDVNNEKCLFLTQEKTTITNFSASENPLFTSRSEFLLFASKQKLYFEISL